MPGILSSLTVSRHEADLIGANLCEDDLQDMKWNDATTWPTADHFKGAQKISEDLKKKLGL